MQQIWERITKLQAAGQPAVLATIIATRGSTPRNVGTKMLVLSDGNIMGTLGGGCAEAEVWQAAMRVMETKVPERLHLELIDDGTGLTTMICGGTIDVFIEPIAANVSRQIHPLLPRLQADQSAPHAH
jgi:xanthine dehydrogenase accessory factor